MRIKGYSNKCLHLANEKFVLASESNLSLATGLASWKVSLEPCQFKSHVSESESLFSQCKILILQLMRGWYHIHNLLLSSINHISFDPLGEHFSSFHFTLLLSQKQFFDVVPISATGFLPPESNATTTPTTTTPGITSGAASTTSPLNTGDVGGGKSGQQVCTVKAFYCKYYDHNKYQ